MTDTAEPPTVTVDELARILQRSRHSIAGDVTKAPHKLPPRLRLPGSRKVLWLRSDVMEWLNEHRG